MVMNKNDSFVESMNIEKKNIEFILWFSKILFLWGMLSLAFHGVIWIWLLNGDALTNTIEVLNRSVTERQIFLRNIEWVAVLLSFLITFVLQINKQIKNGYVVRALFLLMIGMSLFCLLPRANAELRVIADLGGESAVRFYEPIQPVHTSDAPYHPNAVPATLSEENMLPVVSHKLTVGKVQPRSLDLTGAAPMFLLGVDEFSRQWLEKNREKLASMYAVGLVINVQTLDELNSLRVIAPELKLLPAPADTLAERLELYHYPVIINVEGISQ